MDRLEVVPTEQVQDAAEALRSDLVGIVDQDPSPVLMRKSAGEIPQYIYIAGTLVLIMKAIGLDEFFKKFFNKLGEITAEELVKKLKDDGGPKLPENLQLLARSIDKAHLQSAVKFQTALQVKLPSGVELDIWLSEDSEKIINEITLAFARMDEIDEWFRDEAEGGRQVLSPRIVSNADSGLTLYWIDRETLKEVQIPLEQ